MFADDFIPIPSSYLGVIIELKCYGQGVWTSTSILKAACIYRHKPQPF